MVNWKTTLIGALLAAANYIGTAWATGNFTDPKTILVSALMLALGYVAKDAGVTGTNK